MYKLIEYIKSNYMYNIKNLYIAIQKTNYSIIYNLYFKT